LSFASGQQKAVIVRFLCLSEPRSVQGRSSPSNLTGTCSRRCLLTAMGLGVLVGCGGGAPSELYSYQSSFYESDWIYYYEEDDEYFYDGLTDAQKDALRQKWAALPPEEKQEIRDRWGALSGDERARVREAWSGLDADQRAAVLSSMQARARSGTLRTVTPAAAGPSRYRVRSDPGFGGSRAGTFDRGSLGARGGGALGRGGLGGRGGGGFSGGGRGGGRR
jgi:hypothetical protein